MAVRLDEYARKHAARMRAAWLSTIIVSTAIFFYMLYATTHDLVSSILLSTPVFVLQTVTLLVILPTALAPLDILSRAITHVSGRATAVIPPNLNGTRHVKTGLKDMVDTIYTLATRTVTDTTEPAEKNQQTLATTLLNDLPVVIIAFDSKRTIVYA
ncbi:MAG TPA: hypothetical protein PKD68_01340, partial [Candidatus Saccharibacteria bacterium]|nr:hypothetical protein [Candidatus Saccharibacteria bacterium]